MSLVESSPERVTHNILVGSFIFQSNDSSDSFTQFSELHMLQLVSLDLHKRYGGFEWFDRIRRKKYIEVRKVDLFIHYASYISFTYVVEFGEGYRLPSFVYNR